MIPILIAELVVLLKERQSNDKALGHVMLLLSALVTRHPLAVGECQKPELGLLRLLLEKRELFKQAEHKVNAQ